MQQNLGQTQYEHVQSQGVKDDQHTRVTNVTQLNAQILNFAERYQKAIQKFQQAQSFLIYDQQMAYFSSLNSKPLQKTTYPFIINHRGSKNELLVHLGENSDCLVLKPDKVNSLVQYLNQSQLHSMMNQYASVLVSERLKSQVNGSYIDDMMNQKIRITQSQYLPTVKVDEQIPVKKRKTQDELRQDMATGRDMKETKNIPKNFSKAIITYVIKNQELCKRVLKDETMYDKFLEYLKSRKRLMSNIKHMSEMLVDTVDDPIQRQFNRTFRIISQHFLKCHSIEYIFNSRIQQINWHLKYRRNILRALKQPEKFNQIKHM